MVSTRHVHDTVELTGEAISVAHVRAFRVQAYE
jgi:hypothetical protein